MPYRLSGYQALAGAFAVVAVALIGRKLCGFDAGTAGRLLGASALLLLAMALYETLLLRDVLRPLLAQLGARHRLPVDEVRAPITLRTKLVFFFSSVTVFTSGLVLLFALSPSHALWTGTAGRPTGMAAGWGAPMGRPMVAAIGRPIGRGPGTPGRFMVGAVERWGMVMSSSPDLAHVVAPASPPATEHACAGTDSKGTGVTGAMDESNRRTGPSSAELHVCNTCELLCRASRDTVTSR